MKYNYETPIVEVISLDGYDVIRTSPGMTEEKDPLQPGGGNETVWSPEV